MFNLREFIKKGLLDAIGNMADYQVRLNAAGWHDKHVLLEEDLAEIEAEIEARRPVEAENNEQTSDDENEEISDEQRVLEEGDNEVLNI